jgi:hypothetical protein
MTVTAIALKVCASPQGRPADQRQHRHREGTDRLQAIYQYRGGGGYGSRVAGSGDSRRGKEEHRRTRG